MPLPPRVTDLGPYELLLSVAALGSMGRAAKDHGVSQAAVSARLKALERALSVTLFERSARGTRLTEAGSLVADWARPAVQAAAALDEGVTALHAEHASHLRISASLTVAEYLLPGWLVTLRSRHPGTRVSLALHNSEDTSVDVTCGAGDVGFVEGPDLHDSLDGCVVAHDNLVVVVAADHPWVHRRSVDPAMLAGTPLVAREPGSGTREFLESALREAGYGPSVDPALELSSTTAIKNAVSRGIGPGVLSSLAVTHELAAGTLVAVPVRQPARGSPVSLRRALRAVWPAGTPLDGPARELVRIALRSPTESRPLRTDAGR